MTISSSNPIDLQTLTDPKRIGEFTVVRPVLSTTINRGILSLTPYIVVASAARSSMSPQAERVRTEERLRVQVYAGLSSSVLAGEFERAGRQGPLLLHPNSKPGHGACLKAEQRRRWIDLYPDDTLIITNVFSWHWLQRDLCHRRFERRELGWPDAFDPPHEPRATRPDDAI
jgi:hypothetical protein